MLGTPVRVRCTQLEIEDRQRLPRSPVGTELREGLRGHAVGRTEAGFGIRMPTPPPDPWHGEALPPPDTIGLAPKLSHEQRTTLAALGMSW